MCVYFAVVELVGPAWRVFSGFLLMYTWAIGYMITAGVAYAVSDWFVLELVLTVPFVPFLAYFW